MNLNELMLNLALASLLSLITLGSISITLYHINQLQQKINLEDTTLKALLTLSQNIKSSKLSNCAPTDAIINKTNDPLFQDLNLRNNYQLLNQDSNLAKLWSLHKNNGQIISDPLVVTYQRENTIYLNQSLNAQTTLINLPDHPFSPNQIIVLDDCTHAILEKVSSTTHTSITLNQAPGLSLEAPISLSTIELHGFYLGNDTKRKLTGLYYYNGTERGLIAPNINKISINSNTITIKANNHEQNIEFSHSL